MYSNYETLFTWDSRSGDPKPEGPAVAAEMHARGKIAADYYWASVFDNEYFHKIVIWPREDRDEIPIKSVAIMSERVHDLYDLWLAGRNGYNYGDSFDAEQAVAERHNTSKLKSYEHKKLVEKMEALAQDILEVGLYWDSKEPGEEIPEHEADLTNIFQIRFRVRAGGDHYRDFYGRDIEAALEKACEDIQDFANKRGDKVKIKDFHSMRDYLEGICKTAEFRWQGIQYSVLYRRYD